MHGISAIYMFPDFNKHTKKQSSLYALCHTAGLCFFDNELPINRLQAMLIGVLKRAFT